MKTKKTREQWLNECAKLIKSEVFKPAGFNLLLGKVKISCGFPSKGGTRSSQKTIGQCFNNKINGFNEIFINPSEANGVRVLDVLVHELVHAHDNCKSGHKAPFRKIAVAVGLEGRMTATVAGKELTSKLKSIIKRVGKYPHKKLDITDIKKQSTRMIKVSCGCCGSIARMSRTAYETNQPICGSCFDAQRFINEGYEPDLMLSDEDHVNLLKANIIYT